MQVQHFFSVVSKSPTIGKAYDIIKPWKNTISTKSSNETFLKNPMCLFFATSKLCGSNDFNTILLWPIAYVASCSMFGLMVVEATAQPQSKQRRCIFMIKKKRCNRNFSFLSIHRCSSTQVWSNEKLQKIVHPAPTGLS